MASPKLSERARQKDLRQRMRAEGNVDSAIAAEFSRRYRMRPRKAWRHTYGWTLREAAERINDLAAHDGLDPGSKAGMTAAHLCEYEEWPGEALPGSGREPTGRKPTPYILSLLARAYATTVPSLVDDADQAWLPPADRLVIGELAATAAAASMTTKFPVTTGASGVPGMVRAGSGAVPAASRAATTAAGPAASRAATTAAVPRYPLIVGGPRADGPVEGPQAEVLTAAEEARRHAENAAQRDIGDTALERVHADVARLSRDYMTGEPFPLFIRMRRVRARIYTALDLRLWPHDESELYLLLSLVNSLMAVAANDLGNRAAAEGLAQAGWAYATIIGHRSLMAQLQAQLASMAHWSGRPRLSRDYAARGLENLAAGPNAAQLYLHHGRAAAQLGDVRTARRAIGAAADARDREHHDELLEIGGEFSFSWAAQHYLAGAALAELPGAEKEAAAELERATALYDRGPDPGEDHSFGCAVLARTALAATRLRDGQLDAARPALVSVLALPRPKRIDSLTPSLGRVRAELARPRYRRAPDAADLDERIEQFLQETAASGPGLAARAG